MSTGSRSDRGAMTLTPAPNGAKKFNWYAAAQLPRKLPVQTQFLGYVSYVGPYLYVVWSYVVWRGQIKKYSHTKLRRKGWGVNDHSPVILPWWHV